MPHPGTLETLALSPERQNMELIMNFKKTKMVAVSCNNFTGDIIGESINSTIALNSFVTSPTTVIDPIENNNIKEDSTKTEIIWSPCYAF